LTATPTILLEDFLAFSKRSEKKLRQSHIPSASDLNYCAVCKTPENLEDLFFSRKLLQRTTKQKKKTENGCKRMAIIAWRVCCVIRKLNPAS